MLHNNTSINTKNRANGKISYVNNLIQSIYTNACINNHVTHELYTYVASTGE